MDEEILIPKIIDGDTEAFTSLYNLYALKAYRTALLITGNTYTAEDVVQETFITCCRTLKKLKNPRAFSSYFYRTLTRTSWKLSAKDRRNTLSAELMQNADNTSAHESYSELYTAVASLEVKQRTTIILFYFNDLSIRDIAKITGVPTGTVKSRLNSARRKLSKILKKEDYYG